MAGAIEGEGFPWNYIFQLEEELQPPSYPSTSSPARTNDLTIQFGLQESLLDV
jgi:hypothetical protein